MRFFLLAAGALLVASNAFANPASGIIEICRSPGVVSLSDKKITTIPADSTFVQDIPYGNRIGSIIKLTRDASMNPQSPCVRAKAVVVLPMPYAPPITAKTMFTQQFDNGAPLVTHVVEGFQ